MNIPEIEAKIGYVFKDKNLLNTAFVHRSFFNENRDTVPLHNERLEFLGDSVLGLLVSEYLYKMLPDHPEGELSHLRSQIVDAGACALYTQRLNISQYIQLGRGERMNEGRGRETIFADLLEALIGAIYLDGGFEEVRKFFLTHFQSLIEERLKEPTRNWKAQLQDYSQKKYQKPPVYQVIGESGPDHSKVFQVVVTIGEEQVGQGTGASKKQAEQAAAQAALQHLEANRG